MFYHINVGITGITSWFELNKSKEQALYEFVCPFINKEVTIHGERLFNMASFGSLIVYRTEKPVDSDWPIKKSEYYKEAEKFQWFDYESDLEKALDNDEIAEDVTKESFSESLVLLETREYHDARTEYINRERGRYSFFICPFNNPDVDHNYKYVIQPIVKQHQFTMQRADEIAHTGTITDAIIGAINRSRFLVADLTEERPNCYYEVGYAHALRKPIIILAKEGTIRHFDISTYKWNFWTDYRDLKPILEREVDAIVHTLDIGPEVRIED